MGAHLVKRSYLDPWWDEAGGRVLAEGTRHVLRAASRDGTAGALWTDRSGRGARRVPARGGLVEGTIRTRGRFLEHNRALVEQLTALEDWARRRDISAGEEALFSFYAQRVSASVTTPPRSRRGGVSRDCTARPAHATRTDLRVKAR